MAYNVWQPTRFERFDRRVTGSSTKPCEIKTDVGPAYIKCLGNPEGPHVLACEWIGTRIASLMGLQTLDFAILNLTDEDVPFEGGAEEPGPAFATRSEDGGPWSGGRPEIDAIGNPEDIAKLVALDTYLLNWDRRSPSGTNANKDNVFLSREREPVGKPCLLAIDHTHIITRGREITERVARIDDIRNDQLFGLFDAFAPHITSDRAKDAVQALSKITDSCIEDILGEVPREWGYTAVGWQALRTFLRDRKSFLQDNLFDNLSLQVGKQMQAMGGDEE